MPVSTDELKPYNNGGQLEMPCNALGFVLRGEVKRAWVDASGVLHVTFNWVARKALDAHDVTWRAYYGSLEYVVKSSLLGAFTNEKDGSLTFHFSALGEDHTFFLPGDKTNVKRLEVIGLKVSETPPVQDTKMLTTA